MTYMFIFSGMLKFFRLDEATLGGFTRFQFARFFGVLCPSRGAAGWIGGLNSFLRRVGLRVKKFIKILRQIIL